MTRHTFVLTCLLALAVLMVALTGTTASAAPRRAALVVGANAAAPGRKPLRFAKLDASNVADVLRVSGIDAQDVHVLNDPEPSAVLEALDHILDQLAASGQESMLFFYYSGHADNRALYPAGKALLLRDLKKRLESHKATVRIGLIDACRGGGWTGSKGLSKTSLFEVDAYSELSNEGSVLISSSSGLEDAHESELLRGSFFTHHFTAAMRGAGDEDQDEIVTLVEAFEYAKTRTIRDTALHTKTPQHPSFQLRLRGQNDLELVNLQKGNSTVRVAQSVGPIEIIHLKTGLIVLELPRGKRSVKLAVPQGRYLVRRKGDSGYLVQEIDVRVGRTTLVREEQLALVGTSRLAAKGAPGSYAGDAQLGPRPVTLTSLPAGMRDLRFAMGIRHGNTRSSGIGVGEQTTDASSVTGDVQYTYGITDKLDWVVPTLGFAYTPNPSSSEQAVVWGGLIGWSLGYSSIGGTHFTGNVGLGGDMRWAVSPNLSANGSLGATSTIGYNEQATSWGCSESDPCASSSGGTWHGFDKLRTTASGGLSYSLGRSATVNIGVAVDYDVFEDSQLALETAKTHLNVGFGSVQSRGLRPLPLVQLHLSDAWTVDGHAAVTYHHKGYDNPYRGFSETYMLGLTWIR